MGETVFWVWNGWGLLFTFIIGVWQLLHIFVTVHARGLYHLRNALMALLFFPALVLTFVLSGWVAGLLAIILGPAIGIIMAKIFLPQP